MDVTANVTAALQSACKMIRVDLMFVYDDDDDDDDDEITQIRYTICLVSKLFIRLKHDT